MFLHYILNRPAGDLLASVFWAQEGKPTKNDWSLQVKEDLKQLNINLTYEDIKILSKESFRKIVKTKCKDLAFSNLMKEKESLKKIQEIKYNELKVQDYLLAKGMSTPQKQLIFKIRTKMVSTPDNMGQQKWCQLCHISQDNMSHVLDCFILKLACGESNERKVNMSDAYSTDMNKVKELAVIYQKMWRKREELLKQ